MRKNENHIAAPVPGPLRHRGDTFLDRVHVQLFNADRRFIGMDWDTPNVQNAYWHLYRNDDDGAFVTLASGEPFALQAGRIHFTPARVRFSCGCNSVAVRHAFIHFDVVGSPIVVLLRDLFRAPVRLASDPVLEARTAVVFDRVAQTSGPTRKNDLALHCHLKSLVYDALALHLSALPEADLARAIQRAADLAPLLPALDLMEEKLSDRTLRTAQLATPRT